MSVIKRDANGRFAATVRGQKNRLHLRLTDECYRKVNNLAAEEVTSVAAQVEKLVVKGLNADSSLAVAKARSVVFPTVTGCVFGAVGVFLAVKFGVLVF